MTLLFPFSADAHDLFIPLNVLGDEPAELADAQTAGVNGLKNRCIAKVLETVDVRGFSLFQSGQLLRWRRQKIEHLLSRGEPRQALFQFWEGDVLNRRRCNEPRADQTFVK